MPIQPINGETTGAKPRITAPHRAITRPRTSAVTPIWIRAFALTMIETLVNPSGIMSSVNKPNEGAAADKVIAIEKANRPNAT